MARTRQEVVSFLDSLVGETCIDKSNSALNGQCVCLIKNLMDFLGVPNPYTGRGNAAQAGDNYIAQGIGTAGRGWLTICVNPKMAAPYGHIWVDISGGANYESNGYTALKVTKNTRPISQARQFVNFDKWIKEESGGSMAEKVSLDSAKILTNGILRRDTQVVHSGGTDADLRANHVGRDLSNGYIMELWSSKEAQAGVAFEAQLKTFYNKYSKLVGELEARPTKAQLDEVISKLQVEMDKVAKAEEALKAEQAKKTEDTVLLDEAGSWFTKLFNRLFKRS